MKSTSMLAKCVHKLHLRCVRMLTTLPARTRCLQPGHPRESCKTRCRIRPLAIFAPVRASFTATCVLQHDTTPGHLCVQVQIRHSSHCLRGFEALGRLPPTGDCPQV